MMNHLAHREGKDEIPSSVADIILHTARTFQLKSSVIVNAPDTRATSIADKHIPRNKLVEMYRDCMVVIYQQCMNTTSLDEADLFLSCIINGEKLDDVIHKATKFAECFNPKSWQLALRYFNQDVEFSIDTKLSDDSAYHSIIEAFSLSGFYKLFGWLVGESLCATQVTIAAKGLTDPKIFKDLFDCPVYFEGDRSAITFSRHKLQLPVMRTYRELKKKLEAAPFELTPLPQSSRIRDRLELLLRRRLIDGLPTPSADHVAGMLCVSSPTLRRSLAREGTSFQCLLDHCREKRAIELLTAPENSVDDISYALGFSGPSGFCRAFKHWTGMSPSEYRRLLIHDTSLDVHIAASSNRTRCRHEYS